MAKTNGFDNLRRVLRLAARCNATGTSAQAVIDEVAQLRERRRALGLIAGTALAPGAWLKPETAAAVPRYDGGVGIVGAGLAGLACADALAAKGIAATVYEAQARVGGRCWSLRDYFPGQVAERGGEYIDTTHITLRGYANAFGLTLEDVTKDPGEVTYYFDGRHYSEAQIVEEFRAFVPAMQADLRTIGQPTADKFSPRDRALDLISLAEYLTTRGAGPLIRQVIEVAYIIEYGLQLERQSCLGFLLFIHADRRSKFHPFGVFSDERFHVVEGNDAIAQGLAARLPGQIEHGHELVALRRLASGRLQLTLNSGGASVTREHDAVVLTLPFSVLRQRVSLHPSLALPAWKLAAIEQFQYGTNSKMMIGFDGRPWLALHNSNGASYSDLPNHQNTWETNPSRAHGSRGLLTDFSGGLRGASLDPQQPQAMASSFLADLEQVWPGSGAYVSRDGLGRARVHLENWSLNPYALGAYSCNAPGYFTSIAGNEGKPVGNLFFAGEHTDSFYDAQGFLEGAANSGLRAAKEVSALLKKR